MVKNTRKQRRKGGMIKSLAKPVKDLTFNVGSEVLKAHVQKKGPGVVKTIYDEPNSAKDPTIYIYGRKSPSTFSQKYQQTFTPIETFKPIEQFKPIESSISKRYTPKNFDENDENINPNIILRPLPIKITPSVGGKTRRFKNRKIKKSRKNRK